MQVGEGEFFGEVIGLKNSGGLVRPKAKVLISQCSTKTPSFMRINVCRNHRWPDAREPAVDDGVYIFLSSLPLDQPSNLLHLTFFV
jgi:hypothetical protein